MKAIIHVNQHKIRSNKRHDTCDPGRTGKPYTDNDYGQEAVILGQEGKLAATVIYRPDKPLSCGARVWIEVPNRESVTITNKESKDADIKTQER